MQYSLLVFGIVFHNHCNIMGVAYKRVGGWERAGSSGGGWASQRWALPTIKPQTVLLRSQQTTGVYTSHRIDQDGCWQPYGTQPILINAPQWPNKTYKAPTRLYRVSKKPSVKADLAIYSHAVDTYGQCMSESLILVKFQFL